MKPNDIPLYVDKNSNHPPGILKNIPKSVNNRLSKISANQEVFMQACTPFQEALKKSGYDYKLNFNPPVPNQKKFLKKKAQHTPVPSTILSTCTNKHRPKIPETY